MSIETHRKSELRESIRAAINRHSAESGSDTPDFILAEYLTDTLDAFDRVTVARDKWWEKPGSRSLEQRVQGIRDVSSIQSSLGNWNYDDYMMGLANGLILALHILDDSKGDPPFKTKEMRESLRSQQTAVSE